MARRRQRWNGYRSEQPRLARWLAELAQDLRYAARQLARTPGATALVVVTLAVGIGANATMAGVIDRLLFAAPRASRHPSGWRGSSA